MRVITISALDGGWALQIDGVENPMVFTSGAKAEAAALNVSQRLARAGQDSETTILLRGGALAVRRTSLSVGR